MPFDKSPFVSLDELFSLNQARKQTAFTEKRASVEPTHEVTSTLGFHLYVDISLNLALSAAEKDEAAQKFLDILQEYAAIASRAVDVTGARLLEVQGERLHFLVEASGPSDVAAAKRLLTLAYSVVNVAYDRLEPMAGAHWAGCKAAAYFGPALVLLSDVGGGSVVSLGRAANEPAKRLGVVGGVTAGHLAIPGGFLTAYFGPDTNMNWQEINLRTPAAGLLRFVENEKRASMGDKAFYGTSPKAKLASANPDFFKSLTTNNRLSPVKVQGFCFRADLDGFSKQVEEAFNKGREGLIALVDRFRAILRLPEQFSQSINARVIILPWAGDCATLLVLPQPGESFSFARERLPATAALTWHELPAKFRQFGESMGAAKWTVGLAAGDSEEGNDGYMLFTELSAQGRYFRVAAGWAVRRSDDGYQSSGLRGDDTVITDHDYPHLAKPTQKAFSALTSQFFKAPLAALQKDRATAISNATPSLITTSTVGIHVPAPRPHCF